MCKYCKLEQGSPGERLNDIPTIGTIKDGSTIITLGLWRYIDEDNYKNRTRALLIQENVKSTDGLHTVAEKAIEINYCPFCGEKL
jgi:hypothetical protein